jgi:hypothetical protein
LPFWHHLLAFFLVSVTGHTVITFLPRLCVVKSISNCCFGCVDLSLGVWGMEGTCRVGSRTTSNLYQEERNLVIGLIQLVHEACFVVNPANRFRFEAGVRPLP